MVPAPPHFLKSFLFFFSSPLVLLLLCPLYFVSSFSQWDGLQQPDVHPHFQALPHLHPHQSRSHQQAEGLLFTNTKLFLSVCPVIYFLTFFFPSRICTCPYPWMMKIPRVNPCRFSSCCSTASSLWPNFEVLYQHSQCHLPVVPGIETTPHLFWVFFSLFVLFFQGQDTICCLTKPQTIF